MRLNKILLIILDFISFSNFFFISFPSNFISFNSFLFHHVFQISLSFLFHFQHYIWLLFHGNHQSDVETCVAIIFEEIVICACIMRKDQEHVKLVTFNYFFPTCFYSSMVLVLILA